MYLRHFGLRETPFSLTPDTGFFLNRAGYQDALNVLRVALGSGEGFLKVTGEVGTGKTLLCRQLINTLDEGFCSAYLHNPFLSPKSLLLAVADELAVPMPADVDHHQLLKRLSTVLLERHRNGQRVVVCLDEAQALPVETLETLRLLTNLETEKRKLLQVVLFGQPELDQLLARPGVRQLRQRITFSYRLLPMNRPGTRAYVRHRLAVAGAGSGQLFPNDALDTLYLASRGIPRLVNILCHKALMLAYGRGAERVSRSDMLEAVRDTLDAQDMDHRSWLRLRLLVRRWLYPAVGLAAMFAMGAVWGTVL